MKRFEKVLVLANDKNPASNSSTICSSFACNLRLGSFCHSFDIPGHNVRIQYNNQVTRINPVCI